MEDIILEDKVYSKWVDYNGHMNDAAYAIVFSKAADQLMYRIGLGPEEREKLQYTMYTLENHICYLKEVYKDERLLVSFQLIEYDKKRVHVFFNLRNGNGDKLATCEQILIGIDDKKRRSASFPEEVAIKVRNLAELSKDMPFPKELGRRVTLKKQ